MSLRDPVRLAFYYNTDFYDRDRQTDMTTAHHASIASRGKIQRSTVEFWFDVRTHTHTHGDCLYAADADVIRVVKESDMSQPDRHPSLWHTLVPAPRLGLKHAGTSRR